MRFYASLFSLVCILLLAGCRSKPAEFNESFTEAGSWDLGSTSEVSGSINNDQYQMHVKADFGMFWATSGGQSFGDGLYELEVTQISGPLDNGLGILFRADEQAQAFYLFKISSDGYVSISRCANECADEQFLVNHGWFPSTAVNQGLGQLNKLAVQAEKENLIFFVNEREVGRVTDFGSPLHQGDIGLVVEALGQGGIVVAFDNFNISPIPAK